MLTKRQGEAFSRQLERLMRFHGMSNLLVVGTHEQSVEVIAIGDTEAALQEIAPIEDLVWSRLNAAVEVSAMAG